MTIPDDVVDFLPAGPDAVRPFVYEDGDGMSLHFSIGEVQSRMRRDDPAALALDYTRAMIGFLLWQPVPATMLTIGLGGGSLPKYGHRHLPQTRQTVVEINPHVIALRETFCVPPDDARLRVVQACGAEFMHETTQRFDVILVDGFGYDGQPEELCTPGFYDDCRRALAPAGVLVVNLHAERPDCDALVARIGRAFGAEPVAITAADGGNRVVFAAALPDTQQAAAEHRRRWQTLPPVHRHTLRDSRARLAAALDRWPHR